VQAAVTMISVDGIVIKEGGASKVCSVMAGHGGKAEPLINLK